MTKSSNPNLYITVSQIKYRIDAIKKLITVGDHEAAGLSRVSLYEDVLDDISKNAPDSDLIAKEAIKAKKLSIKW